MSEQAKPRNRLINFKFGIRKEFFKAIIFMAIFMGVMIGGIFLFGMSNGMAFGMAIMGVLMTLSNDMTLEPIKNGLTLIGANAGMVFFAFLGYGLFPEDSVGRIVMMTAMTFITFFLAIYLFTSEERSSTYMPLLLSFSLLLYYNGNSTMNSAAGRGIQPGTVNVWEEMLIRLAIYAGAAILAMGLNFLVHGRKFRKKIRASMDGAITQLETHCEEVFRREKSDEELLQQAAVIEKTFSGIEGAMGTKMSIRTKWQAGHDMIRTITILKRINRTITKSYLKTGEAMPKDVYEMLEGMLESIDQFENDRITEAEIAGEFDKLYHHMQIDADHGAILDSVKAEMDDFLEGEVRHEDRGEERGTAADWLRTHINVYNVIFALKTAVLAAGGLLVVTLLHMPMGYMVPLYVGLTAQPYLELSKGSVKKRIINTLYAVGLILISFSITQYVWVHFIILIALTLVADMFFQFDFMTMMGTMFAVIMNVVMQPDQLYSYSFYRLGYIVAVCLLVQIVDMLVFPRRIPATIGKQMQKSLAVNDKLRSAIADDSCSYETIHSILMEKRRADQCLRATNRFAKSDAVTAYLLADEEWTNRMTMINHRLKEGDLHMGDLRRFVDRNVDTESTLTPRQKNILTAFDEVLEDIAAAEQMAAEMQNAQPAAAAA